MGKEPIFYLLHILFNMKYFNISIGFLAVSFLFVSCKKDSVFIERERPELTLNAENERLTAPIIHLVKDTVYILATNLVIKASQELIIDPGTLIKVNNDLSIDINPGGKIEAKGSITDPIIFTSSAYQGLQGDSKTGKINGWNGISISGMPDSLSAVLSYVRIEFAGLNRSSLLLFNLNKRNVINNIQISYSLRFASYEISGDSLDVRNLISYACQGNDFWLKSGYRGLLQNLIAYRHPYFAPNPVGSGNLTGMLIEDNLTFPSVANLTVIGPDLNLGSSPIYDDSVSTSPFPPFQLTGYRVASLIMRNNAKFHIINSALLGFPTGGFYMDNRETALSLNNGESDFTYSIVHSNYSMRAFYLPSNIYPPFTSKDFRDYMLDPRFHNRQFLNSADFMLTDPFNYNDNPNPLPKQGSPLLTGANFEGPVFSNPFFTKVSNIGALGVDNWLRDWTNFTPLETNYNN